MLQTALLVFAGYYLGARLGFALTFLPNPISVLWPPNAILFAALLVVSVEAWWIVLAAGFAAHLLVELTGGVPMPMVLCWYVSNVSEALIGAILVRSLVRRPLTFVRLQHVAAFMFAALVAPFVSSFLDAAFVQLNGWGSGSYWQLWRTRFVSNVLAAITIVPVILTWRYAGAVWGRAVERARAVEAGVLLGGLLATSLLVFDSPILASGSAALTYVPLPLLLWAALRFGPPGASAAFAVVALLVIWGAGHGMGLFGTRSPVENALSVQVFLICVAPSLLCLAAVLEERAAAQRGLSRSEQRFAKAFRSNPNAMSISRRTDGRIIEVNEQWEAMFGCSRRDALGRSLEEMGLHLQDHSRDGLPALLAPGDVRSAEVDLRTQQGESRHVVVAIEPVEIDGQECLVTNVHDVTERRRTEELNQRLAHASRLAAMGELTASIAHEINQPVSATLSNVDSAEMLLDAGPQNLDQVREILDDIRDDNLRVGEIVRHVRNLAKKQEREIESQPFDINELIATVIRLVGTTAHQRRIQLTSTLAELPLVRGDRIHVQQVLLNLMLNGMDAMADAPEEQRKLRVCTAANGTDKVEVAIVDRGTGIPTDSINRVFDSFFTTKREGMGLGLSIARTLVEAQGGEICASNNPDGGATFRFTLPTDARPPAGIDG